jgi:hypothetical protein
MDAYEEVARERMNGSGAMLRPIMLIPFHKIRFDASVEEYRIKGLTPMTGVGVTWGPSQTYKSFVELDRDLHIVFGWDYRGMKVVQGAVVYCAFEGGKGVEKRVEAWRQVKLSEGFDEPAPFYLQPLRLELVKEVDRLIDAIADQTDGDIAKVTLDTLNRSMTGSESKDADMGAYFGAADKLREAFSCFVSIIHHPGWDTTRLRGHTSLPCGVEVEEAVTSPGKLLSCSEIRKQKDGETGLMLASRLESVVIGIDADGDPITSLVAYPADDILKHARAAKRPKLGANCKIVYEALTKALLKDGKLPPTSNDIPDDTPCVSAALWERCSFQMLPQSDEKRKREAFNRGCAWLICNGYAGKWGDQAWAIT